MNVLGVFLGVAALSAGACALDARSLRAEGAFDRTLSVSESVELEAHTASGTIRIQTGDPGVVRVRGRVRCANFWTGLDAEGCVRRIESAPPIEQSGSTIRLGALEKYWPWGGVRLDFDVTVPADAHVRTRTASGDQVVSGLRGPLEAGAASGDIRISNVSGTVHVSTASGRIELNGSEAAVLARAASGSITAMAIKGDIEAHTSSGRVFVSQTANGQADITSSSGNITVSNAHGPLRLRTASGAVAVNGEPAGAWTVRAASGDVVVDVGADAGFDLDARSGSGRINSAHPVTMTGHVSRRQLSGRVRGGGPRLEISTASGAIRIR